MGLFDNIKIKNEAKRFDLTVEQYEKFLTAQAKGLSIEEFKEYIRDLGNYSVDDYCIFLTVVHEGFTQAEAKRYVEKLSDEVPLEDYRDYLEAEKNGLSLENFREFKLFESESFNISDYKEYLSDSKGLNLSDYLLYMSMMTSGYSAQETERFINHLSDKVKPEDYRDFLEAEKLGLDVTGYSVYSSTLKSKMSAVDYVGFLSAQKIGFTLGKYLKYLSSYKDKMSVEEYDILLKSEQLGASQEQYLDYINNYKNEFTFERYLEFDKARQTGKSLEEYDIEAGAEKSGLSIEEYKDTIEAQKLGINYKDYCVLKDIKNSGYIADGVFSVPLGYEGFSPQLLKHLEFASVVFPEGISEIPDEAFSGCSGLTKVIIPESVKRIGKESFKDCTSLEIIEIPDGVEEIDNSAFENCTSLVKIIIPGSVKKVGSDVFLGCEQLKKIKICCGVKEIDVSYLHTLPNLNNIESPQSLYLINCYPLFKRSDPRNFVINPELKNHITDQGKIEYINPSNYSTIELNKNKDTIEYLEVYGDYVFLDLYGFPNLKTVDFHAKGAIKKIENCPALQTIIYSKYHPELPTSSVMSRTFTLDGYNSPSLKFIIIEDGPEVVNLHSSYIKKLAWVHIPESVKTVDYDSTLIDAVSFNCEVKESHLPLPEVKFKQTSVSHDIKKNASSEEKLLCIISALKERYSTGEQKAYNLTDVIEQNLDLPVSSIKSLAKKVYNKSASEYLSDEGIISEPEWMTEMKRQREAREKEERELSERIEAELAAPIETIYYDPPVYHVDEIDISGEKANEWKFRDDFWNHEGEIYIEDYLGDDDCITIPSSINGKKVYNLISFALKECKASVIKIPGSIKTVVGHLGYQNDNINTVIIGEGVESIGESCFAFVKNLTDVKVSRSVHKVGDTAFEYTPWFEEQNDLVIIGSVLTKIKEDHAVVNIPHGITTIGTGRVIAAFLNNIRKVIIPESVTTICENAFCGRGNDSIEEFFIPESLVNIGKKAFGINKWTKQFENEPIIINNQLYEYDFSGESVVVPDGIVKICAEVFKGRKQLKNIVLPSSLKIIGEMAFAECVNLQSPVFPTGLEIIEIGSFYSCKRLSHINLPDTVKVVGRSAFNNCISVEEICLGESVEELGEKAFIYCEKLKSVKINSKTKIIPEKAFANCAELKELIIPEGVEEIECYAFMGCSDIEEITLPHSLRLIGSGAFEDCTALAEVRMLNKQTEISHNAFANSPYGKA